MATRYEHTCAVQNHGEVYCWGYNNFGQLGIGWVLDDDGDVVNREVETPTRVSGLEDAVWVAAGLFHTCAANAAAEVTCWGLNNRGQLGNGTTVTSDTPVVVTDTEAMP